MIKLRKIGNLKQKFGKTASKFRKGEFRFRSLMIDFALIIIIITIFYNVLVAYTRGVANLERLKEEEIKLTKLQVENQELNEKENYYRSIEFRKAYARESLNLTAEGEILYYVVREDEIPEENEESILFDITSLTESDLWSLLLFGD